MPKDIKEIEYKKNNRLGWIAFSVLLIHFSLVIFSIVPESETTSKINHLAESYVDPVFKQKWAMFAPCPILENRLKIKYYFGNDSTHWIDPIENALSNHQRYRFTHHGNIAVGYYNMLYWFKIELDKLKTKPAKWLIFSEQTKLRNSLGNRLLNNYVKGYANENFDENPTKTSLDISYRNLETGDTAHYYFIDYK
ncbi:MAG: DUF5819 family protein [Crocinitomicaceae bacterium]